MKEAHRMSFDTLGPIKSQLFQWTAISPHLQSLARDPLFSLPHQVLPHSSLSADLLEALIKGDYGNPTPPRRLRNTSSETPSYFPTIWSGGAQPPMNAHTTARGTSDTNQQPSARFGYFASTLDDPSPHDVPNFDRQIESLEIALTSAIEDPKPTVLGTTTEFKSSLQDLIHDVHELIDDHDIQQDRTELAKKRFRTAQSAQRKIESKLKKASSQYQRQIDDFNQRIQQIENKITSLTYEKEKHLRELDNDLLSYEEELLIKLQEINAAIEDLIDWTYLTEDERENLEALENERDEITLSIEMMRNQIESEKQELAHDIDNEIIETESKGTAVELADNRDHLATSFYDLKKILEESLAEASSATKQARDPYHKNLETEAHFRDRKIELIGRLRKMIHKTKAASAQGDEFFKLYKAPLFDLISELIESLDPIYLGFIPRNTFDEWFEYKVRDLFDEPLSLDLLFYHSYKIDAIPHIVKSHEAYQRAHPMWIIERDRLNQMIVKREALLDPEQQHQFPEYEVLREKLTQLQQERHDWTSDENRPKDTDSIGPYIAHLNSLEREIRKIKSMLDMSQQIEDQKTKLDAIANQYKPEFTKGLSQYEAAHNEESGIIYDLAQKAILERNRGHHENYLSLLQDIHQLQKLLILREYQLLYQPMEHHFVDEGETYLSSLWESIGNDSAKPFKKMINRREELLAVSDFFKKLNSDPSTHMPIAGNNGQFDVPGAIPLEPVGQEDGERFHNLVIDKGLVAVYVPHLNTRVYVPADPEKALAQAKGKTLYMVPGTGLEQSVGITCITSGMAIGRKNRKWIQMPFIVDNPFHGYSPQNEQFTQLATVLSWHAAHLSQLKQQTGVKPNFVGRSTGGLTGMELARYFPNLIESVVALSPPAPTEDYMNHMTQFAKMLNSLERNILPAVGQLILSALGFGLMNGRERAAEVLGLPITDPIFDPLRNQAVPLRLQYQALKSPISAFDPKPARVLIVFGRDDTFQYPDHPHAFQHPREFPNQPLNEVWDNARRSYEHIAAVGLPGGHLRFDPSNAHLMDLTKRLVQTFQEDPKFKTHLKNVKRGESKTPRAYSQMYGAIRTLNNLRNFKIALLSDPLFAPRDLLIEPGRHVTARDQRFLTEEGRLFIRRARDRLQKYQDETSYTRVLALWPEWDLEKEIFTNANWLPYLTAEMSAL